MGYKDTRWCIAISFPLVVTAFFQLYMSMYLNILPTINA